MILDWTSICLKKSNLVKPI